MTNRRGESKQPNTEVPALADAGAFAIPEEIHMTTFLDAYASGCQVAAAVLDIASGTAEMADPEQFRAAVAETNVTAEVLA